MKPRRPVAGPPAKRPAAIYTRVSTTAGLNQEITSLDMQREACRRRVEQEVMWTPLPESYDDGGFTGANTDRPAFQRLMEDIRAGRVKVVVAYKLDRICRSFTDFARLVELCEEHDVVLVSVTQNFNTGDIMGRLLRNLLAIFAEFERELIVERTRDKIAAARKAGKWTSGRLPLGYDKLAGNLVINEAEGQVVREIFALYLELRSVLAVMKELASRGRMPKVRSDAGGRWTKDMVLRILRCPLYAGLIPSGEELHKGDHQAIIDRASFDSVQRILAEFAGRSPVVGRNPEYLLTGRLRCAGCGAAMTPASTKKNDRTYRFYRCSTRDKMGGDACAGRPLPAPALEGYVVDRLRELEDRPEYAREVTSGVRERIALEREALAAEGARLPAIIDRKHEESSRLLDSLAALNGPARDQAAARAEHACRDLEDLKHRRRQLERQLVALRDAEADVGWVAQVLGDFDGLWTAMTLENRRRLISGLIESVVVDEGAGTMRIRFADVLPEPLAEGALLS
jgi:site-specific DNA recombinase